MTVEVNYQGMAALKGACEDQKAAFATMGTFFTANCGSDKFSSIPVLTLFSPIYSDAAREVTDGLSKATATAGGFGETIASNVKQYRRDDVDSSSTLKGTWKVDNDYTPPPMAEGPGAVLPYNANVRSGAQWGSYPFDGAMERNWRGNPLDTHLPGPKFIGGRGGFGDLVGTYYDGKDAINAADSMGNALKDNRSYEDFESGGSGIDGNTPVLKNRQSGAINLFDVSSALTPVSGMNTGPLIEELKGELGGIVGGINWVLEKMGIHLLDAILGPIAGSFSDADAVRGNLDRMGSCSRALGVNFGEIAGAVDSSWRAPSATKATSAFQKTATACERQGDGLTLMAQQVGHFMTATFEGVKLAVGIVGMVIDELLSVPIAKVLGWILTGAAKVKRWISLLRRAIELIDKLKDIIPPLLVAARAFSRMAIAFKLLMRTLNIGAHVNAGSNVDNTADAVY